MTVFFRCLCVLLFSEYRACNKEESAVDISPRAAPAVSQSAGQAGAARDDARKIGQHQEGMHHLVSYVCYQPSHRHVPRARHGTAGRA
eukprot:2947623-Prymnesium_polylepis.1